MLRWMLRIWPSWTHIVKLVEVVNVVMKCHLADERRDGHRQVEPPQQAGGPGGEQEGEQGGRAGQQGEGGGGAVGVAGHEGGEEQLLHQHRHQLPVH